MAERILIIIKNQNRYCFQYLKLLQKYLGDGWMTFRIKGNVSEVVFSSEYELLTSCKDEANYLQLAPI